MAELLSAAVAQISLFLTPIPPHRLFWPKSKSYDYLYSDGEALLRNFPVQATISFYDESDSEEEDEEEEWEDEESESEMCQKPPSHFTCWN